MVSILLLILTLSLTIFKGHAYEELIRPGNANCSFIHSGSIEKPNTLYILTNNIYSDDNKHYHGLYKHRINSNNTKQLFNITLRDSSTTPYIQTMINNDMILTMGVTEMGERNGGLTLVNYFNRLLWKKVTNCYSFPDEEPIPLLVGLSNDCHSIYDPNKNYCIGVYRYRNGHYKNITTNIPDNGKIKYDGVPHNVFSIQDNMNSLNYNLLVLDSNNTYLVKIDLINFNSTSYKIKINEDYNVTSIMCTYSFIIYISLNYKDEYTIISKYNLNNINNVTGYLNEENQMIIEHCDLPGHSENSIYGLLYSRKSNTFYFVDAQTQVITKQIINIDIPPTQMIKDIYFRGGEQLNDPIEVIQNNDNKNKKAKLILIILLPSFAALVIIIGSILYIKKKRSNKQTNIKLETINKQF